MSTLVKLQSINKIYGEHDIKFQALKDINLEVKNGDFIAIIGPSGSGKSTLMNILGLLDQPTSGSYFLNNQDVSKLSENHLAKLRNQNIGFVFQNFNLLGRTTALDNVGLPLIYAGVPQYKREQKAKDALKQVGLEDKIHSHPNQLSGGQQQRVAIARSLVTNPEIILADEPTGNLDTKTSLEIIKLLSKLNKTGKTIILITHEENIAKYAKRKIHLRDGQII